MNIYRLIQKFQYGWRAVISSLVAASLITIANLQLLNIALLFVYKNLLTFMQSSENPNLYRTLDHLVDVFLYLNQS